MRRTTSKYLVSSKEVMVSFFVCFVLQIDHECDFPVCQLRMDLLEFEIAHPDSGDCNRDQFIIRADEPLPVLCGKTLHSLNPRPTVPAHYKYVCLVLFP